MNNSYLNDQVESDINAQVAKVLRDLGNPKPPLRLDDVRALLRLDRGYYSSRDVGTLDRMIHKLRLAKHQIVTTPTRLLEVVRQSGLKALFLHDSREILIDSEEPDPKKRWNEAHEIGHSVIPWHADYSMGDQLQTLTPGCHEKIEAEANHAAGRLLFLGDLFGATLLDCTLSLTTVRALSREFKNSITTTLWRSVEQSLIPAFALVGPDPRSVHTSTSAPARYFVRSRRFLAEFGMQMEADLYRQLRPLCHGTKGPIGGGPIVVENDIGQAHEFSVELFNNTHDVLVLAIHRRLYPVIVGVNRPVLARVLPGGDSYESVSSLPEA